MFGPCLAQQPLQPHLCAQIDMQGSANEAAEYLDAVASAKTVLLETVQAKNAVSTEQVFV